VIPLVDMHCHLLAGLDDGPRTEADADEMCRRAAADGTRFACATAHQNEHWPAVTPQAIRDAAANLSARLAGLGVALTVLPCAEVMLPPDADRGWLAGRWLSVADRGQYVLVEVPSGLGVDPSPALRRLAATGVRPILAHPEREPVLLFERGLIEGLIECGCLVQVSASSILRPPDRSFARALKGWFKRGVVHLLGSDGHSPTRRPPLLAEAYRRVADWVGMAAADRVASTNGLAVLNGLPLRPPRPLTPPRWLGLLIG
jgi:protein-tyrosine phosphatase